MKKTFKQLNIIFISPEVAPFSKFGGLGDVSWALPRALKSLGHNVKIIMPKFGNIDDNKFSIKEYLNNGEVKTIKHSIPFSVKRGYIPDDIEVYLIENNEYYTMRANVYGYKDDSRRFNFLCKAAIELIKIQKWKIDIIHSNDWMTGYICNYLKTIYKDNPLLNSIATVFTIHNLALQGIDRRSLMQTNIDQGSNTIPDLLDDNIEYVNGMLRGIIYSDVISTVSERYAKEILTPDFGEGMDRVLKEVRNKLVGIRNGVDYNVFDPSLDKNIYFNYSPKTVSRKGDNKIEFQKEFDLEVSKDIPLVAFVGRLSDQKGLKLIENTIRPLLDNINFQFAIVGGDSEYWEKYFAWLISEYPKRVGGHLMISTTFAQKLYAASDIFIYPSRFEPCGIAQAIAMRYGSVPIVRKTGGLADSIIDYNKDQQNGDGFMFDEFDDMAFLIQMVNALTTFKTNKKEWKKIQVRAMLKDQSWDNSARKYVDLYNRAIDRHDKWMKKEGLIMPEYPSEVPGYSSIDILS